MACILSAVLFGASLFLPFVVLLPNVGHAWTMVTAIVVAYVAGLVGGHFSECKS